MSSATPEQPRFPSPALAALALVRSATEAAGAVLAIAANEQQAWHIAEALRFFAGDGGLEIVHLPDTEVLPYDQFSPHQELLSDRVAALYRLPQLTHGIVLTTASSLLERLPPRRFIDGQAVMLAAGERMDPLAFRERLVGAGYTSVSEVQLQGEFAVRGALVDLFPMGSETAYRIDLFDDEIESIRAFDPETQRSTEKVERIRLLPAREFPTNKDGIDTFRKRYREMLPGDPSRSRIYAEVSKGLMPGGIESWLPLFFTETATLFDYLPAEPAVMRLADIDAAVGHDWQQIVDRFERLRGDIERPLLKPNELFIEPEQALARLATLPTLEAPADWRPLTVSGAALKQWVQDAGAKRLLFIAESAGRREVLRDWLKPLGLKARELPSWDAFARDNSRVAIALGPLQDSFELGDAGIAVLSEAQVFDQRAPAAVRNRKKVRDPDTILKDLSSLSIGSPVVHVEHGVGRYMGLQRLDAGGMEAEYLVLEYAGGDKLYVPVGSLQQIHRYTGAEDQAAPLHSLGSDRWGKAQAKARDKAHDVAAELLQIQARRAAKPGFALALDRDDYQLFSEGFPFETTPDQQRAIDAVLDDLAKKQPMDRVVCGDVGFGKTEVAMRACFAMARAGRQVCLLAPTTLLAAQHEKNFRDRFADWPLRIGGLSRLRSTKEQNALLEQLADGRLDIIIGTHRLLQDDVRFKNLGLVIVDEEHRFGVRHKEKLKNLRAEVDLLTLTATPIPRTLNMSLAGLRELSIIATPPASRLAIKTFVAEWEPTLVYEAISRELRRGGQVYVLHNEVRDIAEFTRKLQALVPEASIRFAHGQMRERELEQVMLDFYHQRYNVLVCTTIIESGIDVPTANTILIDRADHLGLAQLHQLRGRVGRSHHRAYAYLLVPDKRSLTPDAEKRLEAIETLGDLGSGFALATHDLEIRGAGELLGDEQSGQIEEVGFTLYAELLAHAVKALKSGAIDDAPFGHAGCEVDLGSSALIPDAYVPDVHTRLVLYKRISEAASDDAVDELRVEMIDRFGLLPPQAERMLENARLRIRGQALGITKIRAGSTGATFEFSAQPKVDLAKLIALIQKQPKVYRLEGQKKLNINAPLDDAAARGEQLLQVLSRIG